MIPVEYKKNYIVYPDGRVWLKRADRFAKLSKHSIGYTLVSIDNKGEWVHRIIAKCFIPNPENKPEVNHINGIKQDNRVENLEWSTSLENKLHSRNILCNKSFTKKKTAIIATNIVTGKTYKFPSQYKCHKILNFSLQSIHQCLKGIQHAHKGYTFEYITN
jgi:hypothetical protein